MKPHTGTRTTGSSREQQARREIGVTDVSRPLAAALTAGFIAVLVAGLVAVLATPALRGALAGLLFGGEPLKTRIFTCEAEVNHDFPAAVALRQPVQVALAALGAGDEQVVLGQNGWLFYRPDVTALTDLRIDMADGFGPRTKREPAAVAVVKAFHDTLAARGIRLVLLPTPLKPGVHPEKLRGDAPNTSTALIRVRGFENWAATLRAHGCTIFDAAPALTEIRASRSVAYLRGDTHWTPEAMNGVAEALATTLRASLPASVAPPVAAIPYTVTHVGDTAMMLALPATHKLRTPETIIVHPVEGAVSTSADVLLLGDSFANIYSLEGMGWGAKAGLAERLAFHLGRPVNAFVRNDGGAWSSRDKLAHALMRGETSLTGVKIVVWQFAERELAHGEWKQITLPIPGPTAMRPGETDIISTAAHGPLACLATVAAVSTGPRLDAPYADFIIKWHVTELTRTDGESMPHEAVVLLFGMRARHVLPLAAIRPGATVALKLRPWTDVEKLYGSLNAGLLDDEMLEIDLPLYWAEIAEVSKQ